MRIYKNTFKSFLRKLNKPSYRAILKYYFNAMIDGIEYSNTECDLTPDRIYDMLSYHYTYINLHDDYIEIFNPSLFSYKIIDEDLLTLAKQKVLLKKL